MIGRLREMMLMRGDLFRELRDNHGLAYRTWRKRQPQTPPYAVCYNIPRFWWEGAVDGYALTFWGTFTRRTFTGEILTGAFDAWHNHVIMRDTGGNIVFNTEAGSWEARLPSVKKLEILARETSAVERISFSFKGLQTKVKQADSALLVKLIPLLSQTAAELCTHTQSALLDAVDRGDVEHAAELLQQGADPNEYGPNPEKFGVLNQQTLLKRPLLTAVKNDDAEMVRLLLHHDAKWRNNPGLALGIAIEHSAMRALGALVEAGLPGDAPVSFSSNDNDSAYEFAAASGNRGALKVFLDSAPPGRPPASALLRSAYRRAAGSGKSEIQHLLLAALKLPSGNRSDEMKKAGAAFVFKAAGRQILAAALMLGAILWSGESPRIAIYGYFFNYMYRILTIGVFFRITRKGPDEWGPMVRRLTRMPNPGRASLPVTVSTGNSPARPGHIGAYLLLMVCLFGFTFPMLNVVNQEFATPANTVLAELLWGLLFGLIWWVEDLVQRRIRIDFDESIPTNLGYNSSETSVIALTVLTGGVISAGTGSPWPYFTVLLFFNHLSAAYEDIRWPAAA